MGKGWEGVRVCSGLTHTQNHDNRDPKTSGLPVPLSRLMHAACVGNERGRGHGVSRCIVPVCGHVWAGMLCAPVGASCPCTRAHVAETLLHAHLAGTRACKQKN